jgi:phosphoribosylamine--glycine ligase
MKVLVIGGGGREHALCWKIAQSPLVDQVICAPGNPGIAQCATCVDLSVDDLKGLERFAADQSIDLTVVGPEAPLAAGITDLFQAAGLRVFGPSKEAAALEASKAFAKEVMAEANIPTAEYARFEDADAALAYVRDRGAPIVIKADGLAAGKGVVVARDLAVAEDAIRHMMTDKVFGDAGNAVIVEECLEGEEASILAFCDGRTVVPMVASQDHKPALDGDKGPNTGGMGAYSPAPVIGEADMAVIERTVLQPCVDAMAKRGTPYTGILYAGLMMTAGGPKVIEFNCRFGDPETQVVLPQMRNDIVPVFEACCDGTLDKGMADWDSGACVSVVMASGGYPGSYDKGIAINGIDAAEALEGVTVFHAGTKASDGKVVTNGGRVLNVTASGDDVAGAITRAYEAVKKIHFDGAHYRTDIGQKALNRISGGRSPASFRNA